uniref:Uncharacterized protein n=1 Tax=Candidatus Kentrum sp. MB TaxID=2138164 RepID=A0A450XWU8_9GAMM|nr:MAG: hypothetical protein BECKMB1821G_GA0114241_101731 [Candidatus Kentron sp. MB]VFK33758.1 MAG: hypothetical protein BECKMB1821I_GA0114274_10532 [Candidatus Kentron sp. MB]VFK76367.1 MAG: hypothetical protein BECKMB1821H_GA0114242_10542 [Candidatus Kentron sp. MB]
MKDSWISCCARNDIFLSSRSEARDLNLIIFFNMYFLGATRGRNQIQEEYCHPNYSREKHFYHREHRVKEEREKQLPFRFSLNFSLCVLCGKNSLP